MSVIIMHPVITIAKSSCWSSFSAQATRARFISLPIVRQIRYCCLVESCLTCASLDLISFACGFKHKVASFFMSWKSSSKSNLLYMCWAPLSWSISRSVNNHIPSFLKPHMHERIYCITRRHLCLISFESVFYDISNCSIIFSLLVVVLNISHDLNIGAQC